MLRNRRLVLSALGKLLLLPSLFGDDRSLLNGSFEYISSVIQELPKEAWEYSYKGGYLFRFQIDVMGDDSPEVFLGSSLQNQMWAVFFGNSKLLGEVRADLGTLRVRRSGESASLLDTYQQSGSEKFISEYYVGPEGVENRSRQVETPADELEYEIIISDGGGDRSVETLKPNIEYIRLSDFVEGSNDEWKPFDALDWVMLDGYFLHRDDAEVARRIRSTSDERFINDAMGGFTPEVALAKLRELERVNQGNETKGRSQMHSVGADRGEGEINPSKSDQSPVESGPISGQRTIWKSVVASIFFVGILILLIRVCRRRRAS